MLGSAIIDVVLGIVFVYLFLSLICSALTEAIAKFFSMRADSLEKGLRSLLHDPEGKEIVKKLYEHPLIKGISKEGGKPSYIPARFFSLALMDIAAPVDPAGSISFAELRKGIANLPPTLKDSLLPVIGSTEKNIAEARSRIEHWFDESMERITGWYKRKAQTQTLLLAVIITIVLNADTFLITKTLYRDLGLRNGLVAAAEKTAKTDPNVSSQAVLVMKDEITSAGMPLGWPDPEFCKKDSFQWSLHTAFCVISKLFGLSLTVLAVSLGAPFWFDVLNKFVNFRSGGKKPEKGGDGDKK